jgi:hypothetical protein
VHAALRRVVGEPVGRVVRRPEDIWLVNPFTAVPKGMTLLDGSIVVFSDGAESAVDVFRTVFHELFLRGSKVHFEHNGDYINKMLTIASADETVRAWSTTRPWLLSTTLSFLLVSDQRPCLKNAFV